MPACWPNLRIDEISKRDIRRIVEDLENRGRLATADQVAAYLGRFFRWAAEEEIIERSPIESLRGRRRLKSRERVLTVEELHDIWKALSDLEYPFGTFIQVLLLTGQRKGEVTGMRWDELRDWNANPVWELPAERTKNRLPHLVPIIPAVKSIIDRCPKHSELVFTATGGLLSGFGKVKKHIDEKLSAIRVGRGVNSAMAPGSSTISGVRSQPMLMRNWVLIRMSLRRCSTTYPVRRHQ